MNGVWKRDRKAADLPEDATAVATYPIKPTVGQVGTVYSAISWKLKTENSHFLVYFFVKKFEEKLTSEGYGWTQSARKNILGVYRTRSSQLCLYHSSSLWSRVCDLSCLLEHVQVIKGMFHEHNTVVWVYGATKGISENTGVGTTVLAVCFHYDSISSLVLKHAVGLPICYFFLTTRCRATTVKCIVHVSGMMSAPSS